MPSRYHVAQICENGHCINAFYDDHSSENQAFCERCGARTIIECPSCHTKIRGYKDIGLPYQYVVPAYCYQCGAPFPWTQSAIEAAAELIREDEQLAPENQTALVASLPDIITETPKSQLAAVHLKKALAAAGKFTADGLRQFAIDFGCELVKKQLGL